MGLTLRLAAPPATVPTSGGGVIVGPTTSPGSFSVFQASGGGIRISLGGLSGTATAPAPIGYPSLTSGWTLAGAGAGGTPQNQHDATLGYVGWRLRCAPAAQNLARLLASTVNAGVYSLAQLATIAAATGHVRLRTTIDVRRAVVVTNDPFECHVAIVSNFPSTGGFLGLYFSDVQVLGTGNWQLAFLSNTAVYNFPFPVPQRLVDTGVAALNHPIRVELALSNDGAGAIAFQANINGATVAAFDFAATPVTANELAVLQGTGAIPRHPQCVASKAAGNDTVDLWVGALDCCLDYFGDIIS